MSHSKRKTMAALKEELGSHIMFSHILSCNRIEEFYLSLQRAINEKIHPKLWKSKNRITCIDCSILQFQKEQLSF